MTRTLLALAAALVAMPIDASLAVDAVPRLKIESTCRATGEGPRDAAHYKSCMENEQKVRADIVAHWSSYSAKARSQCVANLANAYHPSYIELISCLEMGSGGAQPPAAPGAKPARTPKS